MKLDIFRPGRIDYREALALQEKLVKARHEGSIPDTLILLEHYPVLTLGRRGDVRNILLSEDELEKKGVKVYEINRGGDVTYHGPGQIVGYPIFDLAPTGADIKDYVFRIEEVFIRLLKNEFGISADREEKKYTGVWVGNEKITAIGIAVNHWVTMHGFAFNVNTDLSHFGWIHPCGITDKGVTSVQKITGHTVNFKEANDMVIKYFCEVFERD
jgi:lipoyl(octanoyl) transferase